MAGVRYCWWDSRSSRLVSRDTVRAPWRSLGYESAIKVGCDQFSSGPWYAVLMGQSGLTMGLALYEDFETLRRMWEGGSDEQNARLTVATSVTFGEEWDIPVADLEAAKKKVTEICQACHAMDGNSQVPDYPKLAGQNQDYLAKTLRDYKSGARKDPTMNGFAGTLTTQDIDNLAAYFSSQPAVLQSRM